MPRLKLSTVLFLMLTASAHGQAVTIASCDAPEGKGLFTSPRDIANGNVKWDNDRLAQTLRFVRDRDRYNIFFGDSGESALRDGSIVTLQNVDRNANSLTFTSINRERSVYNIYTITDHGNGRGSLSGC